MVKPIIPNVENCSTEATIIIIASATIFGLIGIMGLTMATIQIGVYQ